MRQLKFEVNKSALVTAMTALNQQSKSHAKGGADFRFQKGNIGKELLFSNED